VVRAAPGAPLTADEKRRRDEVAALSSTLTASAELGLIQMLRDAGLAGARIASDSFLANTYCERAELGINFVDAARPLGLLRRIKSPIEIDLMRHAATTSAQAAMAAALQLRAGAAISDLRKAYFAKLHCEEAYLNSWQLTAQHRHGSTGSGRMLRHS
jgi:Xaa-Pro aminopeptidase